MVRSTDSALPDLRGTTVIVTGGSGSLGSGIVRRFAAAGASVVIHHFSGSESAERLVQEIVADGGSAISARADIRDLDQCREVVATTISAFGRLDALVNNAGVQPVQPLAGMTVAEWEAVVNVNLTGTFAMSQAAAEVMSAQGSGSITHIASVEASLPASNHAHYSASKAGIKMHARAAALELGAVGIRVNSVSPGLIDGGNLAEAWPEGHGSWTTAAPLGRTGTPEDIGNVCVFLASPLAAFVSGHDLVVDGGMSTVPAW